MSTRRSIAALVFASAAVALLPAGAQAYSPAHRPDLGDAVEGDYDGNVTSDMHAPPKNSVAVTVTRIGPNRVRITSDYPRLPPVTVRLTRAGGRILNAGGATSFLYDPDQEPPRLDLTFDNEVSWDGKKQ